MASSDGYNQGQSPEQATMVCGCLGGEEGREEQGCSRYD